jgi:hypothetical protein
MFYRAIEQQMTDHSRNGNIFTGDPARQIDGFVPGVIKVSDLASAQQAIATIIE